MCGPADASVDVIVLFPEAPMGLQTNLDGWGHLDRCQCLFHLLRQVGFDAHVLRDRHRMGCCTGQGHVAAFTKEGGDRHDAGINVLRFLPAFDLNQNR